MANCCAHSRNRSGSLPGIRSRIISKKTDATRTESAWMPASSKRACKWTNAGCGTRNAVFSIFFLGCMVPWNAGIIEALPSRKEYSEKAIDPPAPAGIARSG